MKTKKNLIYLILVFGISWMIGALFFPVHSSPALRGLGFIGETSFYFILLIVQLAIVCVIFPIFFAYFVVRNYERGVLVIPIVYVILSFALFSSFSYLQGESFGDTMRFGSNETIEDTGTGIIASILASNPASAFTNTAEYSFMERSEVLPWYFSILSGIMGFIAFFLSFYLGFVRNEG